MRVSRYSAEIPGFRVKDPEVFEVRSPYDRAVVGEVELLDSRAVPAALDVAVDAHAERRLGLPGYERAAVLRRLAGLIREHNDELGLLISQEAGKPLVDSRIEVARAASTVDVAAEEATRLGGREIPMVSTPATMGRLAFTTREPIGVVVAVSAFNHPLNHVAHQVAPAVAAGCPVLIKPALKSPLSCMRFMELLREAGLPPELGMALPARKEVAEQAVTADRIAFMSFIGSAGVGWALRSKLAAGVRCALEHGGAAPVILDATADLDNAVPAIVKSAFYHAGQVSISTQRVFAHQSIKQEVVRRLADAATQLTVGDPTVLDTDVGPLITSQHAGRVHEAVEEARAAGAVVAAGGELLDHQCHAPTVLVDAPAGTRVMSQQVFGPVLVVSDFTSLLDGIAKANAIRWAFHSAVFTKDIDRAFVAARALNGSAVMINDHPAFRADWMPFGGRGPSGLGTGGVAYAMRDLSVEKLVVIQIDEQGGRGERSTAAGS